MTSITPSRRRSRSDLLVALATPQYGVFTWAQGVACGYPTSTMQRMIADGTFRRVQPTVYTTQLGRLALDGWRAAALLATDPDSALIRQSALAVFDCSRFQSTDLHLGVPRRRRRRLVDVRIELCAAADAGHVVEVRGHRVTSFPWTVSDLGTVLEPEQIAQVIQQGRLRGLLELCDLDAVLALRGRFRGCRNVRKALAMYRAGSAGTRSAIEDRVYGWVKELVRKVPPPNMHVRAGDQEFEIDIPFLSRRLCIEVDGPLHDDPDQIERDRVRDAALRAAGFRVERFHWHDIRYRPQWCKRRLRELLAAG
jgi:hypothetical protein